jgi:hypothetical protein
MATVTIAGTISFPLAGEANPPARAFQATLANYEEKSDADVVIAGAQEDQSLMGRIANAKFCYIECIEGGGALKVNGSTPTIPLSAAGGHWSWFNPTGGLTALTITTTGDTTLRVYMFA